MTIVHSDRERERFGTLFQQKHNSNTNSNLSKVHFEVVVITSHKYINMFTVQPGNKFRGSSLLYSSREKLSTVLVSVILLMQNFIKYNM